MSRLLFYVLLGASLFKLSPILAGPTIFEHQLVFAAKNLVQFYRYCELPNSGLSSESKQLLSTLKETLSGNPIRRIEFGVGETQYGYLMELQQWERQPSRSSMGTLSFKNLDFNQSKKFALPIPMLVAKSVAHLTSTLIQKHGLQKTDRLQTELIDCLQSAILKNTELVTAGAGETHIALATFQLVKAKWPSYSRIVLTDGEGFWDLTTQLAGIKKPTLDPGKVVQGVRGMALSGTQTTSHISSLDRYFILPIFQWALHTAKGIQSATIPDEYIQVKFKRHWNANARLHRIDPNSIELALVHVDGIQPSAEEWNAERARKKLTFFGLR